MGQAACRMIIEIPAAADFSQASLNLLNLA